MFSKHPPHSLWNSLRHVASHIAITLLAVGIAFALPEAARYILYHWWPRVQDDSHLMMLTEIGFAGALVFLFNLAKLTWNFWRKARITSMASLVHAHDRNGLFSNLARQDLIRRVSWKRDLTVMAITGYGTFAAADSALAPVLRDCYEVRVMLLNPYSDAAERYAAAHADPAATLAEIRRETESSIACLRQLQAEGKKAALRLYEDTPYWKLVFTGEHAWVCGCHNGGEWAKNPEYVFALQPERPNRGFFPVFYTYFLNQWNDRRLPDYNFETDELVYRDAGGNELQRLAYPLRNEADGNATAAA